MRSPGLAALFAALAALVAAPVEARQPYELMRELQRLQDRAAAGDEASPAVQARVLQDLAAAFGPRDLAAADDPRNARAAVLFALSGGDPAAIGNLEDVLEPAVIDPALVRAARHYAAGRLDAARQEFDAADSQDLPPGLQGQIALSRGIIAADDPQALRRFLDEARLLMPGTLVEEVALRRSALAAAAAGDRSGFESQTRRYFERFPESIYAPLFAGKVVEAVVELRYGGGPGWLAALDTTLAAASPSQAAALWLAIARLALPRGDLVLARHAAQRTLSTAPEQSAAALSARAHLASVRLVTGDFDAALAELEALRQEDLADGDLQVGEQALALAAAIRRWPGPPSAAAEPGAAGAQAQAPAASPAGTAGGDRPAEIDMLDQLIERVEAALAQPDEPGEQTP